MVLKDDVLELGIDCIVFLDHFVVLEDLLGQHFLGLLSEIEGTAGSFFMILRFRSSCKDFPL